jgi:hypothetical protein
MQFEFSLAQHSRYWSMTVQDWQEEQRAGALEGIADDIDNGSENQDN